MKETIKKKNPKKPQKTNKHIKKTEQKEPT